MNSSWTRWDQSTFNESLKRYMAFTSKTIAEVANAKAYFIARKAIWFTPKADATRIKTGLGQFVSVNRINAKGKTIKTRQMVLVRSRREGTENVPLAALIINARRRDAGQPGLQGRKMAQAISKMLGGRLRSVAFLKSGWLPAVKKLASFVQSKAGAAPMDISAKQFGRAKGDAQPARPGSVVKAVIANLATTRRDQKQALIKYGTRGLQRAFDDEAKSMNEYVERKMKPDADKFNRENK